MASEKVILLPAAVCLSVMLLAWHLTQLMLGLEYQSDTCGVKLDDWNVIGGAVGVGVAGAIIVSGVIGLCSQAAGLVILSIVGVLYALFSFGWSIYGYTLLFTDDGLLCKVDDHGHDRSLWIYSLCVCFLQQTFLFGASHVGRSTTVTTS